jgi:predicted metalloprotease with PDZ domain
MKKNFCTLTFLMFLTSVNFAQHPFRHWSDALDIRYDAKQPVTNYILTVDSSDLSFIKMEMSVRNVPDTFMVAMAAHPEDDRYWRFVEDFYVDTKNGKGKIFRKDSSLWQVITTNGEAVLHYKIHLPGIQNGQRSAWKAYLSPTGGLVGGPHSFMYVVGATLAPSHVSLKIPAGWQIVTGLTATSDPNNFFAPSTGVLIDDPVLIGKIKTWSFTVDGVPHRVVYWPLPNATPFDTLSLVSNIRAVVEQASALFGRLPYREYSFMIQDGASGGLEHNNTVTVGAPSAQLANNLSGYLSEITHEYFHTWNLLHIHPVEYADVDYKTPQLSKGLWFSEGLTIFYADLLLRRAGIHVFDSTRIAHLETLIRRYLGSPVYQKFTAEQISLAAYAPAGMLGDYSGSTHLQGEVLGAMLDIFLRDASNGKYSMDDVMRKMMERYSGEKGFTSKDIEQTIHDVCGCNVHAFFQDYVFGKKTVDFAKYLRLMGLQFTATWQDFVNDGKPVPDLRIFGYQLPNETVNRIAITNPLSCWGRAGLHTGDIIKSVNGNEIKLPTDFRQGIRAVKVGDTVAVEIERPTGISKINVLVTGYQQPVVHVTEIPAGNGKQKTLYNEWLAGK